MKPTRFIDGLLSDRPWNSRWSRISTDFVSGRLGRCDWMASRTNLPDSGAPPYEGRARARKILPQRRARTGPSAIYGDICAPVVCRIAYPARGK